MGNVFLIFGALIALNFGFGYLVSENLDKNNAAETGVVEIEEMPVEANPSKPGPETEQDQ